MAAVCFLRLALCTAVYDPSQVALTWAQNGCAGSEYPPVWVVGGSLLPPNVMRFSPGGSHLWTGVAAGGVQRWAFPEGRLEETIWPGADPLTMDILAERALAVMVTREGRLQVMDLATRWALVDIPMGRFVQPRFCPDGRHVILLDPVSHGVGGVTPVSLGVLRVPEALLQEPLWSPAEGTFSHVEPVDGSDFIAVAPELKMVRFRIGQRAPLWQQPAAVWPVGLAPSRDVILAVERDRPLLFESSTGSFLWALPPLRTNVLALAWSPTGEEVAFALRDGALEIRSGRDGHWLAGWQVPGEEGLVNQLVWSPDGRYLLIGTARRVLVWDRERTVPLGGLGALSGNVHLARGGTGSIVVAGTSYGQMVAVDGGTGVRLWQRNLPDLYSVGALTCSPAGDWLAVGRRDGAFEVWSAADGVPVRVVPAFNSSGSGPLERSVEELVWSPDGTALLAGNGSGRWGLFSTQDWTMRADVTVPASTGAAFSPEGRSVLMGLNTGALRVLDARTLAFRFDLPEARFVGAQPDSGDWVTRRRNSPPTVLDVWRAADGVRLRQVGLPVGCRTAGLSPDGQVVFVSEPTGAFSAWELATGRCLARWVGAAQVPLNRMEVHAQTGRLVAVRKDGSLVGFDLPFWLRAWRTDEGLELRVLGRHGPFVLEFRPAGAGAWEERQADSVGAFRVSVEGAGGWLRVRAGGGSS